MMNEYKSFAELLRHWTGVAEAIDYVEREEDFD